MFFICIPYRTEINHKYAFHFSETMVNLERIKKEALAFVEDYVEHVKGTRVLHKKEFYRRYVFSPLKYFHKELGI